MLKGSGRSLPIAIVDYSDLNHLSGVTFLQFNKICRVIDPEEENGQVYRKFSDCIDQIRNEFPYPQYYNSLIGLLLLFHNDESYQLREPSRISTIFGETKELAVMGYEDFENFGLKNLTMLISRLHDMCEITTKLILCSCQNHTKGRTKAIEEDEYFEDINGIKVQTKPIDCSTAETTGDDSVEHQSLFQSIPKQVRLDCQENTKCAIDSFENAFSSVTSSFILTTMLGKTMRF